MNNQNNLLHPRYRSDIDGLRAIAVLSVVAFHAFPTTIKGGYIGVDVFFVISGYLISSIIYRNLTNNSFDFYEFYIRRVRRIFPTLLLVMFTCAVFGWFSLFSDEYKQLGKHMATGAIFVSNITLWNEAGYFDNSVETKPLLHLWSLGVEEQFYIFWPLMLWGAWKARINLFVVTVFLLVVSFYINISTVKADPVGAFYSPLTRFWELVSGSLLAWININYPGFFNKTSKSTLNVLSSLGLLLLLFGFLGGVNKGRLFPGFWAILPVVGALLIIASGPTAMVNRIMLSSRIAIWFGLISFPLYLWHWPILSFARIVESETPNSSIRIALIIISIAISWMTFTFVEHPVRFGNYQKPKFFILLLLMILVGFIGAGIYKNEGYEEREYINKFKNNNSELVHISKTDSGCLKYINKNPVSFDYCRFNDRGFSETVAVIGDSHAFIAYSGISEYLQEIGKNTVLLAKSSCPLTLGIAVGRNQKEKESCKNSAEEIIQFVTSRPEINKVFIFTRGPFYITGTEPSQGDIDILKDGKLKIMDFEIGIQRYLDKLASHGKNVFFVTENPELTEAAESCIIRPLRAKAKDCRPERSGVIIRQESYRNMVNNLSGVTVVDSLAAFCPESKCLVFENDTLLYSDDDHLSITGSKFQVQKLVKYFIDKR